MSSNSISNITPFSIMSRHELLKTPSAVAGTPAMNSLIPIDTNSTRKASSVDPGLSIFATKPKNSTKELQSQPVSNRLSSSQQQQSNKQQAMSTPHKVTSVPTTIQLASRSIISFNPTLLSGHALNKSTAKMSNSSSSSSTSSLSSSSQSRGATQTKINVKVKENNSCEKQHVKSLPSSQSLNVSTFFLCSFFFSIE